MFVHVEPFLRLNAALQEDIETLQRDINALQEKRKQTPHHITVEELPEEARFRQLSSQSKHLLDTLKMIAYPAETAMANSLREHLKGPTRPVASCAPSAPPGRSFRARICAWL